MNKVHLQVETLMDPKELFEVITKGLNLDQMISLIKEKYWSPVDQQKIRNSLLTGVSESESVDLVVSMIKSDITLDSIKKLSEAIKENWKYNTLSEGEKTIKDFSQKELQDELLSNPDFEMDEDFQKALFKHTCPIDVIGFLSEYHGSNEVLIAVREKIDEDEIKSWYDSEFN